ncbi:unnamed protein product (macronuclear) [Paramecium tetraurelia]|uniref:Uncharacterized protein n=1 Tax=Paramecium tetraurelia TaxID=5888 RepID=A0D895_PARTE|nr:uncharacterized protein GSPATT00014229001 [Paramecium tetraurelia]CAK79262.1 unnamed protein product [Paramecium tetraurelia]|eukprot:XP_001446659.1 hypothetical protein (macronuclear) [Paramecium tetraurelia strain d4-2]
MKQKNIQFIGIFAKDQQMAQECLFNLTQYALQLLNQQYQNDQELQNMLKQLKQIYKFPPSIHLTSLFVGNNQKNFKLQAFTDFKEDLEQELVIDGIAISPNNIVTAISNHNYQIPLTNKHSHITTLLGSWKPKDSNLLMEEIFKQLSYEEMQKQVQEDKFWKIQLLQGQFAYVVQFKNKTVIPGVCRMH